MSAAGTQKGARTEGSGNGRTTAGMVAAVLLVVWILVNRDRVDVSFVVWSAELPLWVALALAGLLGAAAGFLTSRRRYRR